jgi:hypothetical protein
MAAPLNVFWDPAGHLHTDALHWEGFPRLLWESLRTFDYTKPPQYDAIITQRNTIIEFLQEQIQDLILEVDDVNAHINELQQQPAPPVVPAPAAEEEEDPEEIAGVSEIDSEHGDPVLSPHHSSSGSQSSVGNLDDF